MIKNNILADFEDNIIELVSLRPLPELDERYEIIEDINEDFYKLTRHNLPPFLLSKLSDWCLTEVLNNKDVDKVTNTEFAILSPRQIRRRDKRELSSDGEIMDYLNLKYVKQKDSLAKKTKKEMT
ncbi:TPA: hypothetical protein ACXNW8_001335 [Clostridium botulinum]|uniref:hypothetical protein n=1 Tax=Clostridium botulinum TaxID=1491 RepID=UPI001C9A2D67|nr:hypothetical protein [Clostridium botulinum]MBY6909537.1 hypothetical protein [Clostridium botulinum]